MPVGKGSLKRVAEDKAKTEILKLNSNNVVEIDLSGVTAKRVTGNDQMVESVKKYGVILPIIVAEKDGGLVVIDGAKRVSALKKLGVKTVKAVVIADEKQVEKELKRFEKPEKVVEKIVEKVVVKEVVRTSSPKVKRVKKDDIHEQKFNVIKQLGEDMPVYLL